MYAGKEMMYAEVRMCNVEDDLCTMEHGLGNKTPDMVGKSTKTGTISIEIVAMENEIEQILFDISTRE